jgi:hypothetical protein
MMQRKYDYRGAAKATELHLIPIDRKMGSLQFYIQLVLVLCYTKKMPTTISRYNLHPCFHGSLVQNPGKLYKFIWLRILAQKWLVKVRSCTLQVKRQRSSFTRLLAEFFWIAVLFEQSTP